MASKKTKTGGSRKAWDLKMPAKEVWESLRYTWQNPDDAEVVVSVERAEAQTDRNCLLDLEIDHIHHELSAEVTSEASIGLVLRCRLADLRRACRHLEDEILAPSGDLQIRFEGLGWAVFEYQGRTWPIVPAD